MARWKSTLLASWLAQICSILGFAAVVPFLPFYVRELGVKSDADVLVWSGWLSSGAGLTMALVSPIWGCLADRHGRKLMVMRSMFGGMVVLGLMAFVHNVYQLLGLRILQGVLTGTVSASVALVSSVVPTRRAGFALGLMQTALFVGNAFGPEVGGSMAQAYGYRIPFLAAAGFLLLGGLLTAFAVHEDFDRSEMEEDPATSTVWQVYTLTGFSTMIWLLFLVQFSGSFVAPILPLYIERLSGLPQGQAASLTGHIFGAAGLAAALAAAILGRMGDRLGYGRVLFICTLLTGATLIPQAWVHNPTQLLYWRLLTAFCGAGTIPAANAMIRSIIPRHACGKAFGLTQSISCLGWGLGPGVGSVMAKQVGLSTPFIIVGCAFILISGWVSRVLPRMTRQVSEEAAADAECERAEIEAADEAFGTGISKS